MKKTKAKQGGAKWYASQAQFCVATGKSKEDVRRAARDPFAGKTYFRVSRVAADLVEWIDKNPALESASPISEKEKRQAEKLEKENRKLDFEHDLAMKVYVKKEEIEVGWAKGMEIIQKIMLTYLDKTIYNKIVKEMKRELETIDL